MWIFIWIGFCLDNRINPFRAYVPDELEDEWAEEYYRWFKDRN